MRLDILSLSHHSESFVLFEMPQSEIHDTQYKAMTDRQSIHTNLNLLFPVLNCPKSQTHCADSATGMLSYTCASNKRLPSLTYLSCQLPHHSEMENCTSQQFECHLYLSISQGFYCKIIWKAWGSGFWGWFPVGCKGIQMAAFKS